MAIFYSFKTKFYVCLNIEIQFNEWAFCSVDFFLFVIDHILHLSAYAKVQKECWMKISGIYSNSICVSRSLPLLGPLHWNPLHRRSHIMITENIIFFGVFDKTSSSSSQ